MRRLRGLFTFLLLIGTLLLLGCGYEVHDGKKGELYLMEKVSGRMWLVDGDRFFPVSEQRDFENDVVHSFENVPSDAFPRGLKIEWKWSGARRREANGQFTNHLLWRISTGKAPEDSKKDKRCPPNSIGISLLDQEGFTLYSMNSLNYKSPTQTVGTNFKGWRASGDVWVLDEIARQVLTVSYTWVGGCA